MMERDVDISSENSLGAVSDGGEPQTPAGERACRPPRPVVEYSTCASDEAKANPTGKAEVKRQKAKEGDAEHSASLIING
jgi:hypothetical protein